MENKYFETYLTNKAVKSYVDKYCTTHGITYTQALKHVLVREYIDEVLEYYSTHDAPVHTEFSCCDGR